MKKRKKILKNRWFRLSLIVLLLLVIGELVARYYFGLGDVPVFIENKHYEYIYAPNQDVRRFGNRITTNQHSMRSKPLKKGETRVLLIGDSVINGGAHVDQQDLVTTLLEQELDNTRVLNISAGSWGPDNALAYINQHGHFDASLIIVAFSSHDYNDNMHHRKVVGAHKSWPDSKPFSALTDGINRYLWPRVKSLFGKTESEYAYLEGFDDSAVNPGWKGFKAYCEEHDLPLLIYHHPEQGELSAKVYDQKGLKLERLLDKLEVRHISGLEYEHSSNEYRDNIHLNATGHKRMSEILLPFIQSYDLDKFKP